MLAVDDVLRKCPFHEAALFLGAISSMYGGDPNTAIDYALEFLDFVVDPRIVASLYAVLGIAYVQLGRDDEAVQVANQAAAKSPSSAPHLRPLPSACAHLGRIEKAQAILAKSQGRAPDMAVRDLKERARMANTAGIRRYLAGLCMAGMPAGEASPRAALQRSGAPGSELRTFHRRR